eukprot:jgi/Mesvir1/28212/Mv04765-RA.1
MGWTSSYFAAKPYSGPSDRGVLHDTPAAWGDVLGEDGEARTEQFLKACESVLEASQLPVACRQSPVFEALGTSMYLGKKDFSGNIRKLKTPYNKDPAKYQYLGDLLQDEKQQGVHLKDPSGTIGTLWLRRSLEFLIAVFDQVINAKEETTMTEAMDAAYDKTLLPFHGWLTEKAMRASMYVCETKEHFIAALGPTKEVVFEEMRKCSEAMAPVLERVKATFLELDMEDTRKV